MFGATTLNDSDFKTWRTQVLAYIKPNLGADNQYVLNFESDVQRAYLSSDRTGVGILKSIIEDLNLGLITSDHLVENLNPVDPILKLFDRFPIVTRQLRSRHDGRATLDINDEYDVQDLLHSLLSINFDDIRSEEWAPSYAGRSSRMDFLIKDFKIVIEVKKTRNHLKAKELGEQLIIDIAKYQTHSSCETLLCFVYDPEGLIANPRGIENDLSRNYNDLKVRVFIRPL